ncbi:MAG: glycoside hydrolase family 5 protein [Chitinophagales bacterium]
MNKKFQLAVLIFLFISILAKAQINKYISTSGSKIIGTDGKEFLIRGTNLGNWLVPEGYMFKFKHSTSPSQINQTLNELIGPEATKKFWNNYLNNYITLADIHYLKSLGINSIRLPFHYKLFTDENYLGGHGEQRGFAIFDKLIGWCRREGIFVILDMHCAPGGQTGDNIDDSYGYPFLFDSPESQQLTINIWRKIANHYKNETAVLGYDLLNEPIAHYFDASHFNPLLEPLYKKIISAIREVDRNHLVFLGGAQWDSNFKIFGPPFDKKSVYTFHKYWTSTTRDVIQEYLDFREKWKVPIYAGETGENDDEWISQFRTLLEANGIGWHFWPYKKMDDHSGIVTFKTPSSYALIKTFADTSRSGFEEIRNFRPKNEVQVKQALDEFLMNCLFPNCKPNTSYIRALGLGSK